MYISVVQIDLPPHIDRTSLKQAIPETAPRYADVADLLRKYYCVGAENQVTGGVFI